MYAIAFGGNHKDHQRPRTDAVCIIHTDFEHNNWK